LQNIAFVVKETSFYAPFATRLFDFESL